MPAKKVDALQATEMGFVRLGFTVADYALGRLHREAADAQLVEWLRGGPTPDAPAQPSDMKL